MTSVGGVTPRVRVAQIWAVAAVALIPSFRTDGPLGKRVVWAKAGMRRSSLFMLAYQPKALDDGDASGDRDVVTANVRDRGPSCQA